VKLVYFSAEKEFNLITKYFSFYRVFWEGFQIWEKELYKERKALNVNFFWKEKN
jgi:hypothetical protein